MTTNNGNFTFRSEMCPRVFVPSSSEKGLMKILKNDDLNSFIQLITNFKAIDVYFPHNFFASNALFCSAPPVSSVAAFYGAVNCLQYLINNGCNLNLKDSMGTPISHFAVASGSFDVLNILNNNGIQFDTSSLYAAADCGNYDIFMWIYCTQNADILKRKEDRTCLLHHAVNGKSWKLIKFLIKELESILDINDLLEINLMIQNSTLFDDKDDDDENESIGREEENESSESISSSESKSSSFSSRPYDDYD